MVLWQEHPELGKPIDLDDPQAETKGFLSLGITWLEPCDVDIYVTIEGDKELSYKRVASRKYGGRHLKDHRSAPMKRGYESCVFTKKINLRDLNPIWLNFYSGSAPDGIHGELRLRWGDDIYLYPFEIKSNEGNGGRGPREGSPHWLKIDPRDILNPSEPN